MFLSVLPTLPLSATADEARVAAALRAAGATVMARYGASLRRAAVAEWEVRLRVPDGSGAWRLVVSSPTGEGADSGSVWGASCPLGALGGLMMKLLCGTAWARLLSCISAPLDASPLKPSP